MQPAQALGHHHQAYSYCSPLASVPPAVVPVTRSHSKSHSPLTGARRVSSFDRAWSTGAVVRVLAESTETAEARFFMRKSLPLPAVRASPFVGQLQPTRPPTAKHTLFHREPITGILRGHHQHPSIQQAYGKNTFYPYSLRCSSTAPYTSLSTAIRAYVVRVERFPSVTAAEANHRRIANSYPRRTVSLTDRCSFGTSM